jgi:hypothetical protein
MGQNPKHEIRNPKWFDQLTILRKVEGQYQMSKIQMIETIATAEIMKKDLFWSFKNLRFV